MADRGATDAFSRRPLSRAFRPFIGPILKGSKGSRNYGDRDKGLATVVVVREPIEVPHDPS